MQNGMPIIRSYLLLDLIRTGIVNMYCTTTRASESG
jgi:hypothetical protein